MYLIQCREESVGVVGASAEDAPRAPSSAVLGTSSSEVATGPAEEIPSPPGLATPGFPPVGVTAWISD